MAISTIGTNSLSDPIAVNGYTPTASNMQPFNRIINGAMTIDQRNAGAAVTPNNIYTLDRWTAYQIASSKFTVQQSSVAPNGFRNSLLVTSLSSYTAGTSEYFFVKQVIEGFNVADLMWGTANAKTVTLSFQVRSSLTGTFGGSLWNYDGSRSYPFTYTISTADTYETKTVTIAGDTSGTWNTTNGSGVNVAFGLGAGSSRSGTAGSWAGAFYTSATGATSVVGTSGATFYITGVQLEAGSTASSFAYENYGDTLQKCQRYYCIPVPNGSTTEAGFVNTTTRYYVGINFPVTMRASPTLTLLGTIGNVSTFWAGASISATSYATNSISNQRQILIFDVSSGLTLNAAIQALMGTGNSIVVSAEL